MEKETRLEMGAAFQRIRAQGARNANLDKSLVLNDGELSTFTKSMRRLYHAGIPINDLLRQIQQTTGNQKLALALGLMVDDIENGKLLSEAMARFPNAFSNDYIALIRAAEQSGKWTSKRDRNGAERDGILEMLISYIHRRNTARSTIKNGLMYPSFVALAILCGVIIFAFYILPGLRSIFVAIGPNSEKNIGILTRCMFWFGDTINAYWWALPVVVAGIAFFLWSYWKSGGHKQWEHYQLKWRLIAELNTAEVCWLMGTLFSAGLTPQEALDILAQSARNKEIGKALELAKEYLYQGISFSESLKRAHWIFGGDTFVVLSTSQKTGQLGVALQDYAKDLFEKSDEQIAALVKMIEPAILCVLGVVVGLIVISYYSGLSSAVGSMSGAR